MFQHDAEPFAVAPHHDPMYMPSKATLAGPLYLQQCSLEIIQLVEVPAPPRIRPSSSFMGSSFASSSYSSSMEESEDESECSSYCSSDPEEEEAARTSAPDDTYKTRLHRVLVWREKLAHAMGVPAISTFSPLPLKRKSDDAEDESYDDDMVSHSSKRSRSSSYRSSAPRPPSSLSAHSCPACDASFSTRQGLRQHAQSPSSNDACRTAVEYECEA
ncbi:uncharacterized protein LAESUDRAFT_725003 [Laetiporus sulphureus 93-53]|uniref:C2H2-type domain-containing protein n=1 Tax=Laetiporus sulphureus 93-53 TaxID=1314785 RepID=A0A165EQA9_9APHY|nr:uncharacterized protein LAESUDRAFT_725003 [Laetiporus sulphureus 93-53]KZT07542.1 hypothetical protein LAESUDRAFT_725003 [Laetiporus sulphureus 93-53]